MKNFLTSAFNRATQLTREQNLNEATRVLMRALTSGAAAPAPQPAAALQTAPPPMRMEASDFAPPPRQFADVQSRLEAISRQIDTARRDAAERADHHLVVMRQIEALRRDLTEMSGAIVELAPRASIGAIETALRELSRRIDTQRGQGVAAELLAPAERIAAELRTAIKELDPGPLVRNLHADVQTIGRRLDALQQPGAVDPVAIDLLVSQTRDIRSQLAGLAARPLPLEKIEARLVDLNQRVELLARAGGGAAKAAVALDMGEVARSIRAIVAEETSSSFDTFSGRLETLAARLDAVVSDAGGAQRFDELGKRIDDLGHKLATRIAAAAATQAPRPDSAALEALVAGLARKLDTALEQKPQAPVIEEIGRKLDALETRLPDANAIDSIARIEAALASRTAEQDFADLAQRIDGVRETLAQKLDRNDTVQRPDVGAVERLVRGLDHKVDTALATGASARDIAPILSQLEQLTRKVDLLDDPVGNPRLGALLRAPAAHPKLDEIATRLDHMQVSLAHRAEEGARVEARQAELTDLVEQLAAGISQAAEPRGDIEAIRALERQIGALSQRLDRNDHSGAALAAVEAKIGALVAHIEESRTATTLAAEEAVRRATQEMLREASPDADALRAAIERELADIRNLQDENGQRTHETLLAVHETLERVVDRLAIFEDELSELRATPPVTPPVTPPKPMAAERTPEPAIERRPPRLPAEALADSIDLLGPAQSPRRATIVEAPPERGAEPVQMDFIAAARRAAQQAARDAQAAERAHLARRAAATVAQDGEADSPGKGAGLIAAIQERKRPLLLGLGAMVLMVGAYQVARIGIDGADGWRQERQQDHQHAEIAPGDGVAPTAPAEKTDRPAPKQSIAPPDAETGKPARPQTAAPTPAPTPAPRMILPQGGNLPVDKTPVGSIGTGGLNPLPPPQQDTVIRTLAEQGNPAAQFELAVRLAEGRGVPRDPKLAAQWFEKAAAQGLAPAQYRLGSLYEKGVGVERDQARARKLYLSAAEAGNARAMHNLAVMLAEVGLDGKPDYAAASEWFRRAGEAGVRDSQYNLAILYARGLGVKQSLVQSYVWFAAAAAQGDADADKKREEVGARLDSKELAAAKAAAAAFRAKEAPKQANEVAPPLGGWENVRLPASPPKPGLKPKVSTL
jgi:localization factor PodJL